MTIKRFLTLGLTLLLTMGAWADISFGSEKTVSKTTTWTFNDLVTGTKYYEADPATNGFPTIGNAYMRTQKSGRCFTVTEVESTAITFSDATVVNVTKYLKANAASGDLSKLTGTGTANTYTDSHKATGVFAFNATVAGTVYVYMKGATGDKNAKLRIYHSEKVGSNGSLSAVVNTEVSSTELQTLSYTSKEGGVFYICAAENTFDIYAIRFEPQTTEPEPNPEVVSVFLTAGQSNTAGRCMNENLPEYIKALGSAYQYCNWSYTNGMTRKSESEGVLRKFWPEMESSNTPGRFAYDAITYYYIEQALQKDFYVVKHATGGTSIDPSCTSTNDYHWSADATWIAANASCNETDGKSMLKALCSNIDKTLDALTAAGKTPDVKCMLWHQGESDRSGTGPDGYHDNLKAVVKYVRDYLVAKTGDEKYATLPIICGTVPTNSKQYNKKVYDALFALASEDANFHVIETSPGTFIGDQLHFDANCAERLGIGMYNKMVDLGLVNGEKQAVPEASVPVVHLCGDSMMSIYGDESTDESANATYTQGMRGWGQFFQDYFTTESGIIVQDWAHTGTTAKGFYGGANYWKVVMGTNTMTDAYKAERPYVKDFVPVKAGDYVVMCWGHNDQKGSDGYKTITESEYTTYLTKMVNEVKAKGAYPILATSICRALFSGNKLTRLGKIDACEAAGAAHSDTDDPYDYPAAMRKLAAELDVPCIDLNAASQTLWEDFGPSLTASVFFKGVGTTHTAEDGARAMGIAANLIIRDWDTTTDTYQDYATLKAAMKTDIEQYDKADYATAETTVATETVWTFEKSADGQTTYANGDVITNELLNFNGLYLRGHSTNNHGFKAQGVTGTFTFSNDKQVSWTMGAIASAMTLSNIPSTAGAAVTTSNDRCIAINTSGPGTFYIAMRTKSDPTSGRYFKMAFNGTEVDSKASSKSVTELKYHAEEAGTFYAWGTEGYIVVAAYYVPDADTSEEEMHEPGSTVQVTIGAQGMSSFSCSQALDFSGCEELAAYVASRIDDNGHVVLKCVTEAPAKTGLIVKGEPGEKYEVPVVETATAPANNLLVATVSETPVAASTTGAYNYMFAYTESNGLGFYNVATATTSAAGKAYLNTSTPLSSGTGARSFVFEGETTSISTSPIVNPQLSILNYYNLSGQRVTKPTKGVYIVNGRRVVVK